MGVCLDPLCTQTLGDSGGTLSAFYDKRYEKVTVQAILPDSSYAGWGWGPTMKDTEMLIFSANGD